MNTDKEILKIGKKFKQSTQKYLTKGSFKDYVVDNARYNHRICEVICGDKRLLITTGLERYIYKRQQIVETLRDIDFERGNKMWTERTAIGFMTEVMDLYRDEIPYNEIVHSIEYKKQYAEEISRRYNVPSNKLKSQLAFIFTRYRAGYDTYHLYRYFSNFEIVMWIYRDIDKLNSDLEKGKVTDEELRIVKQFYEV